MGGVDKGLQPYRGQPLAAWALQSLMGQLGTHVRINANRNLPLYHALLQAHGVGDEEPVPDDIDLQGALGPLAGMLTGLRHTHTPWLMCIPCDTPSLPADLCSTLMHAAIEHEAHLAVPMTQTPLGELRPHWACVLIHRCSEAALDDAIRKGERRVGKWIQTQRWIGVSFPDPNAFLNINSLEVLHGQA